MKYIKYTYVDGNHMPQVEGLEFVWARESQYPTNKPEFFGTCPSDSNVSVDGVLGVFSKDDWDTMRSDEMRARVPSTVTRAQGKYALIKTGRWQDVCDFMDTLPQDKRLLADVALNDTLTWKRSSPFMLQIAQAIDVSDEQLDDLFYLANGVEL